MARTLRTSASIRSLIFLGLALALIATPPLIRAARALVLLSRLTPGSPPLGPLSGWLTAQVRTHELTLEIGSERVRARRYEPDPGAERTGAERAPALVLLHGVHPRGIDEGRLRAFAHALAASGVDVLTPELSELLAYRIHGGTTRKIRALAAAQARTTGHRASTVLGISFAGGLALMAAGEQRGDAPIGSVVAVGAHHDLLRLCRYYAGEGVRGPGGERADVAPHPYGARVMVREHLDQFFAPDVVPLARRALDSYLRDQHSRARSLAEALPASAQPTMATLLADGRSAELAQLLRRAAAAAHRELVQASPQGKLQSVRVPVYLVHGERDPIIPSIETLWLAHELPASSLQRAVVTPLLRHAEFPDAPPLQETWELVTFLRDIRQTAGGLP